MFRLILRILSLASITLLAQVSAETYTFYLPENTNKAELRERLAKLLPRDKNGEPPPCNFHILRYKCTGLKEAELQAEAIAAGVTHIPSLVIGDLDGPYATLLLNTIQRQDIEKAREQSVAPDRKEKAQARRFKADLFLLFARCQYEEKTPETLEELINESHALLGQENCGDEERQLIGLRCLYPLLMKQYADGHQGGHSPATEAKLLEAIAALEEARDINPESQLGKQANDERHRLRMARRKARNYE